MRFGASEVKTVKEREMARAKEGEGSHEIGSMNGGDDKRDWGIALRQMEKGVYIHNARYGKRLNKKKTKKIVMAEKRIFMLMPRETYAIFRYIHRIMVVVIVIIVITMGARVLCA